MRFPFDGWLPNSKFIEGAHDQLRVREVWEERVRLVREQVFGTVHAPGGDGDGACSVVTCAGDVVGRVADDDELRGLQV